MTNTDAGLDKCRVCNGAKIIAPLGGIQRKCKACKGVGYIEPMISMKQAEKIVNASIKIADKMDKVDKRSKAYRDSIGR